MSGISGRLTVTICSYTRRVMVLRMMFVKLINPSIFYLFLLINEILKILL